MTNSTHRPITVSELVAALQALLPEHANKPVLCFAEAGFVTVEVLGIAKVEDGRVTLDGY